jgi:hypothetical protein
MRVQLKRPAAQLHLSLTAASCALLSGTARAQTTSGEDATEPLQLDAALLYYKENAGRVQVLEPMVSLKKDFGDLRTLARRDTSPIRTGSSPCSMPKGT